MSYKVAGVLPLFGIAEPLREYIRGLFLRVRVVQVHLGMSLEVFMKSSNTYAMCPAEVPHSGITSCLNDADAALVIFSETELDGAA